MSNLTIEHKGRELRFNENDESWSCSEMSMHASSLNALKTKLDKFDAQARKVAIPVARVDHRGETCDRVTIVTICAPKDWEKNYSWANGKRNEPSPTVWVTEIDGNKTKRSKVRLNRLVAPDEHNMVAVALAAQKCRDADKLKYEAMAIIAAIPRLSLDDLQTKGAEQETDT